MFQVLPVWSFQSLNLQNHVVALFHSLVDQVYFVVDKSCVVFYLLFQKSKRFLLGFELVLDFFEYTFFKYFRVIGGHPHDVLNAIVEWRIIFLEFIDLGGILDNFVLDGIDDLLDDFSEASLHFEPFEFFDRRTTGRFAVFFGFVLKARHVYK